MEFLISHALPFQLHQAFLCDHRKSISAYSLLKIKAFPMYYKMKVLAHELEEDEIPWQFLPWQIPSSGGLLSQAALQDPPYSES